MDIYSLKLAEDKGRETGREEERMVVARNMISAGMALETVSQLTGLTEAQLDVLGWQLSWKTPLPASALPILTKLLMVSVDELLGQTDKKTNGKRGPTPKLQQQLERVSLLPRSKQQFVMEMLDTVIQQAAH